MNALSGSLEKGPMQQSNAPLLIVGAGRSGTTLLVACLNGHPRVEMKNEYCSIATLMGHAYPVSSVYASSRNASPVSGSYATRTGFVTPK